MYANGGHLDEGGNIESADTKCHGRNQCLHKINQIPRAITLHLNKEEDSIEGEWSKETADKDVRLEGEKGEVRRCKEDQVQV